MPEIIRLRRQWAGKCSRSKLAMELKTSILSWHGVSPWWRGGVSLKYISDSVSWPSRTSRLITTFLASSLSCPCRTTGRGRYLIFNFWTAVSRGTRTSPRQRSSIQVELHQGRDLHHGEVLGARYKDKLLCEISPLKYCLFSNKYFIEIVQFLGFMLNISIILLSCSVL